MSLEQPNWNSREDRKLYDLLFYRRADDKKLSEQEQEFITTMYHFEEYASGLGGD